ncbi:DUF4407 domain-containing protein [Umezawaea sp.]|uniref:DUF4407 domain-containing protein n=1 Tax=Umezawaea sp. TaxID=1955258 RepID=UPI002ED28BF1
MAGRRRRGQRQARGHHARLRQLNRWARLLSFVSTAVVGLSIFVGAWAPTWVSVVATVAVFLLLWSVNGATVTRVLGEVRPPRIPLWRHALGLCAAFFVAFSAVFWVFGDEVETARGERAVVDWDREAGLLRHAQDLVNEVVEREVPPVDLDPAVHALGKRLADLEAELARATDNELCELDGGCGTQEPGKGDAYFEKKERRHRVERDVDDLKREMGTVRAAAETRFADLTRQREDARTRAGELAGAVAALGPRPDTRTRFGALSSVESGKRLPLLWFGVLTAYFAVDVLALQWVARRVCRPPGRWTGNWKGLIGRKAVRAEDSRVATPAAEFLKREGGE